MSGFALSCPVCLRPIMVSAVNGVVFAHFDTARNQCPMSGHSLGVAVDQAVVA